MELRLRCTNLQRIDNIRSKITLSTEEQPFLQSLTVACKLGQESVHLHRRAGGHLCDHPFRSVKRCRSPDRRPGRYDPTLFVRIAAFLVAALAPPLRPPPPGGRLIFAPNQQKGVGHDGQAGKQHGRGGHQRGKQAAHGNREADQVVNPGAPQVLYHLTADPV